MVAQCPVPKSQRPLNEYNELKNSFGFKWTVRNPKLFFKTIGMFLTLILLFTTFLFTSIYDWQHNFLRFFLSTLGTSFLIFTMIILKFYLSWKYVYDRLMNAAVNYEESGWYDGQTWIKTNKILMQDRLIGSYEVLPTLNRLKLLLCTGIVITLGTLFTSIQIGL
jgi:hypothetical protein